VEGSKVVDWGQGLYAAAQKEILEVLLNEPSLFHSIEQDIAEDLFDVPILSRIASTLFAMLRSGEDFTINRMLAQVESPELAQSIVELQQIGEGKGCYCRRLEDALGILWRRKNRTDGDVGTQGTGLGMDPTGVSRGRPGRQNPHSIGLT